LIGGVGVPAGVHYYEKIAASLSGDNPFPILLAHANLEMGRNFIVEGRIERLAEYLGGIFTDLSRAGATVGTIAAVTPYICLEQLRAISPIPIIDLPAALNDEIRRLGLRRVGLFGTNFVIESDLFGYLDVEVVKPAREEIADVDAIYLRLARGGKGSQDDRERLSGIARRLIQDGGAQTIVLAGTDFVTLYDAEPPDFPAIDTSRAHIAAIVDSMASGI